MFSIDTVIFVFCNCVIIILFFWTIVLLTDTSPKQLLKRILDAITKPQDDSVM